MEIIPGRDNTESHYQPGIKPGHVCVQISFLIPLGFFPITQKNILLVIGHNWVTELNCRNLGNAEAKKIYIYIYIILPEISLRQPFPLTISSSSFHILLWEPIHASLSTQLIKGLTLSSGRMGRACGPKMARACQPWSQWLVGGKEHKQVQPIRALPRTFPRIIKKEAFFSWS